jgi:hypothetical protein
MAKVDLGIAFDNIRGKAGNLVIQDNRSGLFIRKRVVPRNPQTAAQQAVRGGVI